MARSLGRLRQKLPQLAPQPMGTKRGEPLPVWARKLPEEFRASDVERLGGITKLRAGQVIAAWRRHGVIADLDFGLHRFVEKQGDKKQGMDMSRGARDAAGEARAIPGVDPAIQAAMETPNETVEDRWKRIRGGMKIQTPEVKLKGED